MSDKVEWTTMEMIARDKSELELHGFHPAALSLSLPAPQYVQTMALREYFAGQALAGLVATLSTSREYEDTTSLAAMCYSVADAMIEAGDAGTL